MAEKKILPSNPFYSSVEKAQLYVAALKNPHVHFDLQGVDPNSPEIRAEVNTILEDQARFLNASSGSIIDFIAREED